MSNCESRSCGHRPEGQWPVLAKTGLWRPLLAAGPWKRFLSTVGCSGLDSQTLATILDPFWTIHTDLGPERQIFAVETGQMSSVETRQISAVETGQMSAAETGQASVAETRQMSAAPRGIPEARVCEGSCGILA